MINKATLDFLRDLERNNNRDWFHANKDRYETAKENVLQTVLYLTAEISKFDPAIKPFDPKKGLFRIARDTRFSKNKDPYKLNFGACINPEGKKYFITINILSARSAKRKFFLYGCLYAGKRGVDRDSLRHI